MENLEKHFYLMPQSKVLDKLSSSLDKGLDSLQITQRQKDYGPNAMEAQRPTRLHQRFFVQINDFMIWVLIAAAIISGFLGDLNDTLIILAIVVLNAIVGVVQEYKTDRSLQALNKMTALYVKVLRSGEVTKICSDQLVPGDIVLLESGNIIPADLRILDSYLLSINESSLTGEASSVDKDAQLLSSSNLPLGDRTNMAYKGTIVTRGRGRGVVVAIGLATEFGKLAFSLQSMKRQKTPLQLKMSQFGQYLTWGLISICILIFIIGLRNGVAWEQMLLVSIGLAVAAIPEALPAVITLGLAMGAHRLAKKRSLIRRLSAVEALGSVTYICSDKTGTLTENKMKIVEIYIDGQLFDRNAFIKKTYRINIYESLDSNIDYFLLNMVLNNDSIWNEKKGWLGEPTETAMTEFWQQTLNQSKESNINQKWQDLVRSFPRLAEIPFDSTRKRMTTEHLITSGNKKGKKIILLKGAPESIVPLCVGCDHDRTLNQAQSLATKGLRVLAFAYRFLDEMEVNINDCENNLNFVALAGLMDPPRASVFESIKKCKKAGITPIMITGDHPKTALAIAKRLELVEEGNDDVITGPELNQLDEEQLGQKLSSLRVIARVNPEQKIQIVKLLQKQGQFVAMTGDGINDAPALKMANIGIAMGITGTDVSKEASDMILTDDHFATIVDAIEEGRKIFSNIKKFIRFALTSNSGEVLTIFLAPFLGLPLPLLPVQILWVNLITDGLPGLALTKEMGEENTMNRPPRDPNANILAEGMWLHILFYGTVIALVTLLGQKIGLSMGSKHWQTMTFTIITLTQLFIVLEIKSEKQGLFHKSSLSNPFLYISVGLGMILHFSIIYLPLAWPFFKTGPLNIQEFFICLGLSLVVIPLKEIEKWFIRKNSL